MLSQSRMCLRLRSEDVVVGTVVLFHSISCGRNKYTADVTDVVNSEAVDPATSHL